MTAVNHIEYAVAVLRASASPLRLKVALMHLRRALSAANASCDGRAKSTVIRMMNWVRADLAKSRVEA